MREGLLKGEEDPHLRYWFPFQQDKVHFLEAAFFNELAEDKEATPSRA